MNKKYLVVHTYLDLQSSKEKNRPVWRSIVNEYKEWELAHSQMRGCFRGLLSDSMIAASFGHDSAYIETEDGGKEIWAITKVEG